MRIRRIKLRKEYRPKARLFIIITFSLCFIFIPKVHRAAMVSFFSKKCRNYQQVYSRKLNDRIPDYAGYASLTGIKKCEDANDIGTRILSGQLCRVKNGRNYKVEDMAFSYPYLTPDSKKLLDEIGRRYKKKVKRDGLMGSRFIITSMTRTSDKINGLGKTNINASDNSPHLNGNAFDISYARFSFMKLHVTECDKWYMKEALAEVIWQLKAENKCWATYEKNQGCFHVVSR
jgi:Family of unknown function (DUF5715)